METPDIAVLGGGPIGSRTASKLSKLGFQVSVYEEHPEIGDPDHCAGLVNAKNIGKLYSLKKSIILNKIKGAIIRYGDKYFRLQRGRNEAYVLDRAEFDRLQSDEASEKGVKFILGTKISGYNLKNKKIKLNFLRSKKQGISDILIDAGGVKSLIKHIPRHEIYNRIKPALQFEIENVRDIDKDYVELYFNTILTPGFFSWIIPINENKVRVGLATSNKNNLKERLTFFIKKVKFNRQRFKNSEVTKIKPGLVITSGPLKNFTFENVFLVGDSAGQVKPTTGGGIITGGIASAALVSSLKELLRGVYDVSVASKNYALTCNKLLGREFKMMSLVRRILDNLNEKTLKTLFDAIEEYSLLDFTKYGDMDFQSNAILRMLKPKNLAPVLVPTLTSLIRSLL